MFTRSQKLTESSVPNTEALRIAPTKTGRQQDSRLDLSFSFSS